MRLTLGVALLLTSCTAGVDRPTAFGSPERTAHFLTCLPVALQQAQVTAQQIEEGKDGYDGSASQVLDGINKRLAAGDVIKVVVACGPYVADLVAEGNTRARELQAEMKAKEGK